MAPTTASEDMPVMADSTSKIIQEQTDVLPSSTPVEMSQLSQHPASATTDSIAETSPTVAGTSEPYTSKVSATVLPGQADTPAPVLAGPGPTAGTISSQNIDTTSQTTAPVTTSSTPQDTTSATPISPSTQQPTTIPTTISTTSTTTPRTEPGPSVLITLMLISGKRHPFKIDTPYLKKRNVFKEDTTDLNPFDISIYTLKELIWRDWREEWEDRPTVPGSIRLIWFGKVLEDKALLKDIKLQPAEPNIFHLSVKPQDFLEDEENAKLKTTKSSSSRRGLGMGSSNVAESGETSAGCCRCVVM